eukprot:TRINITY_DN51016_c0_g1_i1.p1 TRINITY_DN51016_c0_g1~~TRINITY_DN51016_c0_g1_i1.p1  ORF type:complete len:223 (+),score=30.63 TRINITY_DN51016_c0_g1_i1:110-778(+)
MFNFTVCCCANHNQDASHIQPAVEEDCSVSMVDAAKLTEIMDSPRSTSDEQTFVIEVSRCPGQSLGLELSTISLRYFQVVCVGAGPLEDWNDCRTENERPLLAGDKIVEVNGIRGQKQMLAAVREDENIRLTVQEREEFPVIVSKDAGPLGIDIKVKSKYEGLLITKINEGSIFNWNIRNPERQVNECDRVVEINGFRGTSKDMFERLKSAEMVHMVIVSFR